MTELGPAHASIGVSWWELDHGTGRGLIAYRGPLADGAGTRIRYSFDGWAHDPIESPTQSHSPGLALASVEGLDGKSALDLVIRDGSEWDNNLGADYRLWTNLNPLDSHLHVESDSMDRLGLGALNVALRSAGISQGIISWRDNTSLDFLVGGDKRFSRLVWVNPVRTDPAEVADRLARGHVGLKLHPAVDNYPADDRRLDPYIELAATAGAPVAVHSGPGNSDPAKIARLAARFPAVSFVLYHTYLGIASGKRRAVRLARSHPNLVLETSWCSWNTVNQLIDELGPDRVLFGTDAPVDGAHHYASRNVAGRDTYKEIMSHVVRRLGVETAQSVLGDNARRLFRLQSPKPIGDEQ